MVHWQIERLVVLNQLLGDFLFNKMENSTTNNLPANITENVAKVYANITLTKASISIQKLATAVSSLVYNEDNLVLIKETVATGAKAKTLIAKEIKRIKERPAAEVKACIATEKALIAEIDAALGNAPAKLDEIIAEISKRKRIQDEKLAKEAEIRLGISKNLEHYSSKIASCETFEELRVTENRINLEKANKGKYGELYDEAKEAYESLTNAISLQKDVIKQKQKLDKELQAALAKNDDDKAIEIQEKVAHLDAKIEENKVLVQEKAINIVVNQSEAEAEEIFQDISAKRRWFSWEVADIKQVQKSCPEWVELTTVDAPINEYMKEHKEQWLKENKEEIIYNGIRFFLKKNNV